MVDDVLAVMMTLSFLEVGVGIVGIAAVVVVVVLWLLKEEKDGGGKIEEEGGREGEAGEEEEDEKDAAVAMGRTCTVLTIVMARVVVMPGVQGASATAAAAPAGQDVIS